jgi:membrane-bound ClpP family serine protease
LSVVMSMPSFLAGIWVVPFTVGFTLREFISFTDTRLTGLREVIALMLLEALFISGGLLGAGALVCAIMGGIDAYELSPVVGWVYLLVAPLVAIWTIYWGIKRMPDSALAARTELTEPAGYHWHAQKLGIEIGSTGTLLGMGRPDARARFPGGVIDVSAESGTIPAGSTVRVVAITGTGITVVPQSTASAEAATGAGPATTPPPASAIDSTASPHKDS